MGYEGKQRTGCFLGMIKPKQIGAGAAGNRLSSHVFHVIYENSVFETLLQCTVSKSV
jgi:hypothetical protein